MMNVVYGLVVSVWMMALGDKGDPKGGVVAPLQVAGVAAGTSVLLVGGAAIIAYSAYGWWGQSMAASDACGNIHVGKGKPVAAPAAPSATPAPLPETQVPTPQQLAPEGPAPTEETPAQP